MKHIPDHIHPWLDRASWGIAITFTMFCIVKLYNSLPDMVMPTRIIVQVIPAMLICFVSAVILKAIFMGLYLLASKLADRDYDDYHKKD